MRSLLSFPVMQSCWAFGFHQCEFDNKNNRQVQHCGQELLSCWHPARDTVSQHQLHGQHMARVGQRLADPVFSQVYGDFRGAISPFVRLFLFLHAGRHCSCLPTWSPRLAFSMLRSHEHGPPRISSRRVPIVTCLPPFYPETVKTCSLDTTEVSGM